MLAVMNQPNWLQIEEMKNCVHEAGHAVIARLTGFDVAWVSVDPNFIKNDPLAIENGCNLSHAVCLTISSDRLNPIINRRSELTKEQKETIMGYSMHVLAGPCAEERMSPETFYVEASQNDLAQVAAVLMLTTRTNKAMCKKLHRTARRKLEKMLEENWGLVVCVADALQRYRTLSGAGLDQLIAGDLAEAA
jgi:hypothetical protein